eukprot:503473-Rhodomonas_salina.5
MLADPDMLVQVMSRVHRDMHELSQARQVSQGAWGPGSEVREDSCQGSGFRVQGSGLRFRVQGSGFRVQGSSCGRTTRHKTTTAPFRSTYRWYHYFFLQHQVLPRGGTRN